MTTSPPPVIAYLLCNQFWGLHLYNPLQQTWRTLVVWNEFILPRYLICIICPHLFFFFLSLCVCVFVFSKHFSWSTCSITSILSSMFRFSHFLSVLWEMSLHTYLKQHLSEWQLLLPLLFVGVRVCYLSLLQASWEHQFAIWFVRNCLT